MNIPARYCTGYLSDIGEPLPAARWIFPRGWRHSLAVVAHVRPAEQRTAVRENSIARGRDAADVPLTQTFGENTLTEFKVWTDELA